MTSYNPFLIIKKSLHSDTNVQMQFAKWFITLKYYKNGCFTWSSPVRPPLNTHGSLSPDRNASLYPLEDPNITHCDKCQQQKKRWLMKCKIAAISTSACLKILKSVKFQ